MAEHSRDSSAATVDTGHTGEEPVGASAGDGTTDSAAETSEVAEVAESGEGGQGTVGTEVAENTGTGEIAEPDAPATGERTDPFDLDAYHRHTEVSMLEPRYRVSARAPFAWTFEVMWSIFILIALQIGWYFWGDNVMAFWNWVAAVATVWVAFTSMVIAPVWRYRVARWDFSETAVYAKTGWWTHQYRIAPLSRLQTVHTKRTFFDRIFGLSSVVASTASAHGSVEIKGLDREDAEALADHLLHIAELDEGEAT